MFWRATKLPKIFQFRSRALLHTLVSVSSWCSVILYWSGTRQPPIRHVSFCTAHDARYRIVSRGTSAAQSTNGLRGPKGASGRAPLQSPRGQSLSVLSVAPCRVSQLGRAGALDCSPQTGVWGRAPILTPKNFGALLKYLALGIDHDQVEFLSTEAPGLEPPQVDHQLPSDGHHGLFLQRPVSAAQDFLPFLNRLILGLKEDQAPGRLHSDAPNGWYSHFGAVIYLPPPSAPRFSLTVDRVWEPAGTVTLAS